MKNKLLLLFLAVAFVLSGCVAGDNNNASVASPNEESVGNISADVVENNSSDVAYTFWEADWYVYTDVKELVDHAEHVFIGKVSAIDFDMLPQTVDGKDICLHTVFTLDVITSYKGATENQVIALQDGGIKDKYVDKQLKALGTTNENSIPVMIGARELTLGKTYLFLIYKGVNQCSLINPEQCAYDMDTPEQKDLCSISAKDIISYFGSDKWAEINPAN